MKTKHIPIEIYEWDLYFIEAHRKDKSGLKDIMSKLFSESSNKFFIELDENLKNGEINGGEHFYNNHKRISVIILYPTTSKETRTEILCHEKRHAEDRILEHLNIKDVESSAYLAGFLAKKLFF